MRQDEQRLDAADLELLVDRRRRRVDLQVQRRRERDAGQVDGDRAREVRREAAPVRSSRFPEPFVSERTGVPPALSANDTLLAPTRTIAAPFSSVVCSNAKLPVRRGRPIVSVTSVASKRKYAAGRGRVDGEREAAGEIEV